MKYQYMITHAQVGSQKRKIHTPKIQYINLSSDKKNSQVHYENGESANVTSLYTEESNIVQKNQLINEKREVKTDNY